MFCGKIVNRVNGVEAERVDVIFRQPIEGVVDDEPPDEIGSRAVVIDRLPPGRPVFFRKIRPKVAKVIPLNTYIIL